MGNGIVPINADKAREQHGITAEHTLMENEELRFRLKKDDGTAYIRTEAPPNGGWQNGHFHNKAKETYIVQKKWIGYAELVDGIPSYKIYKENQIFTTPPFIVHNIYMPKGAVAHTVKHGNSKGEKRKVNGETQKFTELTMKISEKKLKGLAIVVKSESKS
jgi:hypothetical protein